MLLVKICGITNREDALAAVDAGARALGFIFVSTSPRHVTAAQVEPWINEIPAEIWKVGVFANEAPGEIERIAARAVNMGFAFIEAPISDTSGHLITGNLAGELTIGRRGLGGRKLPAG